MLPELTFISLFAGIGGIDLGLERAGMRCVAQVEIDDYCNRVLQKHWPNVPRFKDVRAVGAHNLPSADLICGGFPCQDISNAGKRAGITGNRSGLWFEFARVIRELRPRYVLVENVAALLVRGMGDVLGELARYGYDAEWECIPASAIGAPHIRNRVFILAHTRSARRWQDARSAPGDEGANEGRPTQKNYQLAGYGQSSSEGHVPDATSLRRRQGQRTKAEWGILWDRRGSGADGRLAYFDHYAIEPDMDRMAYGVPCRVDRLRGLGNAVVPQVAEFVGRAIVAHYESEYRHAA